MDELPRLQITKLVREFFKNHPNIVWSAFRINKKLNLPKHSVSTVVNRMGHAGEIERVRRGYYILRTTDDPVEAESDRRAAHLNVQKEVWGSWTQGYMAIYSRVEDEMAYKKLEELDERPEEGAEGHNGHQ